MKAQANEIRPGWVIEHNGRQWAVIKSNLLMPGKGGAFVQVEMRNLQTGNKTNERWRTNDMVEKLMQEEKDVQFLYSDGDNLMFMYPETYEQLTLPKEIMGDALPFLVDGMDVKVTFVDDKPVAVVLPKNVVLTVETTDPNIKNATATTSFKPAILSNGVKVMVPPFIESGTDIVVNTEDSTYVERAK